MKSRPAIVGVGHTEYSKASGRSDWQLAAEAIRSALDDAGIDASEVDGIVRYSYDKVTQAHVVRSFDIPDIRYYTELPFGGVATGAVIAQAAGAIASGQASVVVVYRALNVRSGVRYGRAERNTAQTSAGFVAAGDGIPAGAFAAPYGLLSPGQLMGLLAHRYAYDNGLTAADLSRTLGTVAVQQRAYANNNPDAIMRDRTMTMEDYEQSRMLSTPLRLFDYCLESDGAIAMVLVSGDRAASMRDDAAYVLSSGQSLRRDAGSLASAHGGGPDDRGLTKLVERLYADAGLTPADIDVALLYEVVTTMVPTGLESYGFAPRGEGWKHVLEHGIGLDSPIPVNTHGGHLSEAYIHGMGHVLEGVRQVRGTSPNQKAGASKVLVGAGPSAVILGRND